MTPDEAADIAREFLKGQRLFCDPPLDRCGLAPVTCSCEGTVAALARLLGEVEAAGRVWCAKRADAVADLKRYHAQATARSRTGRDKANAAADCAATLARTFRLAASDREDLRRAAPKSTPSAECDF